MSPFTRHIAATIPFNVDNDCRFGTTVCLYGQALGRKLTYHSLASADGCMARTISEFSCGNIITLTNSPTTSNKLEFYKKCPESAYFWHGPFSDISLETLREKEHLKPFHCGFDIIFEDLGFQMYDPNRYDQIEFVKRNLKPNGIMLFYEKLLQSDELVYEQREQQKDNCFKARHFTPEQIQEKKQTILLGDQSGGMQRNQVTMEKLMQQMSPHFKHAVLVANSGNFYRIAASDNADALKHFVGLTLRIPQTQYCYESLPRPLFGLEGVELSFREPDNAWFYKQLVYSR